MVVVDVFGACAIIFARVAEAFVNIIVTVGLICSSRTATSVVVDMLLTGAAIFTGITVTLLNV